MIGIYRKGKTVICKINGKFPVSDLNFLFEFNCDDDAYAKLLANNLFQNLIETIEKIRKAEYESGWKDAKSKKKKREYFYSSMRPVKSE